MATTQAEARVQIAVPGPTSNSNDPRALGHVIDIPMPNYMTVGDCLAELIPFLRRELSRAGKDVTWLDDPTAHWSLRRPFHSQPLDPEKTPEEEKVRDGTRLLLVKEDPGEKFSPLFDDVAESITYWLREHFPSWNDRISSKLALTALPAVIALLCILATYWASVDAPAFNTRVVVCSVMTVGAVLAAAIAIVVIRADKQKFRSTVAPFLIITYLLIGTAALLVTPRPLGIYQLVVTGAALFTTAICLSVLTHASNSRLHYGVAAAALAITFIAALNMAYRSPTAVLGVQLVTVGFLIVLIAPRLALSLARISLPYVPAPDERYDSGDGVGDLDAGNLPREGSGGRSGESILNQEEQILNSYDSHVGLLVGTLAVLCGTGWFIGHNLDNHHWLIFSFVMVISLALVYRGKSYDDALLQAICLIAATILLASFGTGLITSDSHENNLTRAVVALGVLLLAILIATVYAVQQRRIASPIVKRVMEVFERLLYATPFVFVVLAMDLYQKARAR